MAKRNAEEKDDAPVSAFAALKSNGILPKSGAYVQAATESTESFQNGGENEDLRAVKKRVRVRSPITRSPSGYQDNPVASYPQGKDADTIKSENHDEHKRGPLQASTDVACGQSKSVAGVRHQFKCSDLEVNSSQEGSVQQLSTFRPTKDNVIRETLDEWTIRLNETDKLTFLGQYDIWVRKGAVIIMGAILHAGSTVHRVHAPSTHSLPVIRACQNPFMPNDQKAEITILSLSYSSIRQLRGLSPSFARIWNYRSWSIKNPSPRANFFHMSYTFLESSAEDFHQRPLYPVECSIRWQRKINQLRNPIGKQPVAVMVCGLKGTGKSTFCRMLANSMLSARANTTKESYGFAERGYLGADGIAFLDLDPGQPEYSPPGEVTLTYMRQFNLGVPYTHPIIGVTEPNRLVRAHHIGAVSANVDPEHYRKCALDLFQHYKLLRLQDPSCPLIVNCSGWVTASGLEVLVELIRQISLTDIVYTTKGGPPEVYSTLGGAADKAGLTLHALESQQPTILTKSAADLRMMQALSYFHIDEPEGINPGWSRIPLNEVAPIRVRYSGPSQDIFALMILGEEQDPDLYGYIFEGSIVGVVVLEDDSAIAGVGNDGQLDRIGAPLEDDVEMSEIRHEERTTSRRFNSPHALDLDLSIIDESDDAHLPRPDNRSSEPSSQQPSGQDLPSKTPQRQKTKPSNADTKHPFVSRTPEGLPYLSTGTGMGMQPPLDPSKSHSLGQALIRGIDPGSQTIQLLTPIPTSTLQSLTRQKTKIVLVRGALDMPTWAYMEEYVAMANRRGPPSAEEKRENSRAWAMKEWAKGIPWAEFKDGTGEKSSAKVRHSRRNLRTG